MTVKDIVSAIERVAPLRFQDDFDNSGLQVGFPDADVRKVLVCLDVTEAVVAEAVRMQCQMIVSHHPLLFHPLRQVSDATYQQRCVVKALAAGIAVYSAHTSLDNAPGGVNFEIADRIGLVDPVWLKPGEDGVSGSGLIGVLPEPEKDSDFLARLGDCFLVENMRHSECTCRPIRKVAVCGGAGAFLMRDAIRAGADCFVTGEFHYHDYFENDGMLLAELGHYQSEQYTVDLLGRILERALPGLQVVLTSIDTNPIQYDAR